MCVYAKHITSRLTNYLTKSLVIKLSILQIQN